MKILETVRFKFLEPDDIFRFEGGRQDMRFLFKKGDRKYYESLHTDRVYSIAWWDEKLNKKCEIYKYGTE